VNGFKPRIDNEKPKSNLLQGEANSSLAGQAIPLVLRHPEAHNLIHKGFQHLP